MTVKIDNKIDNKIDFSNKIWIPCLVLIESFQKLRVKSRRWCGKRAHIFSHFCRNSEQEAYCTSGKKPLGIKHQTEIFWNSLANKSKIIALELIEKALYCTLSSASVFMHSMRFEGNQSKHQSVNNELLGSFKF